MDTAEMVLFLVHPHTWKKVSNIQVTKWNEEKTQYCDRNIGQRKGQMREVMAAGWGIGSGSVLEEYEVD